MPARRFHFGWVVVAVAFLVMVVLAGIRSSLVVFIDPLERQMGWTRAELSSAIALTLLVLGISAPLAGRLCDTLGPRRVVAAALVLAALGIGGTVAVSSPALLGLLWGLVLGVGAGLGTTVVAASVAVRWFVRRRGVVLGLLNAAGSTGQLLFVPLAMVAVSALGWQATVLMLAAVALALLGLVGVGLRDDPQEMGLAPYGADSAGTPGPRPAPGVPGSDPAAVLPLRAVMRHPFFWMLAGSFFLCGATSQGLVGTHLIPHALGHGMPQVAAAAAVGVMGGMNFLGTLLAGWLTDRIEARWVLMFAYAFRGLSLLTLPFVHDLAGLLLFAVVYGLDWFATVPPIIALSAEAFGPRSVASVYGWVFLAHQVGAALAASAGGLVYIWLGDYRWAFLSGAALAGIGAALAWSMQPARVPGSPGLRKPAPCRSTPVRVRAGPPRERDRCRASPASLLEGGRMACRPSTRASWSALWPKPGWTGFWPPPGITCVT